MEAVMTFAQRMRMFALMNQRPTGECVRSRCDGSFAGVPVLLGISGCFVLCLVTSTLWYWQKNGGGRIFLWLSFTERVSSRVFLPLRCNFLPFFFRVYALRGLACLSPVVCVVLVVLMSSSFNKYAGPAFSMKMVAKAKRSSAEERAQNTTSYWVF